MSRSGYDCDGDSDNPVVYLWESITARAIAGRRGQTMLRDLARALDEMPALRLVAGSFKQADGEVCTLGALARSRGEDITTLQERAAEEASEEGCWDIARQAGTTFGVARSMAAEVMYQNDEAGPDDETPEARWARMRRWVSRKLAKDGAPFDDVPDGYAISSVGPADTFIVTGPDGLNVFAKGRERAIGFCLGHRLARALG